MTSRIESTKVSEALDSLLDEYTRGMTMRSDDGQLNHSNFESVLLNSKKPAKVENEMPVIEVNGVKGYWINRDEVQNWRGKLPIDEYEINYDRNPKIIKKKMKEKIDQNLFIGINYLRPPTPPKPGDIIIREDPPRQAPPLSPIVKREIYYVYKDGDTKKASHKPTKSKLSIKSKAKKQPNPPRKETYPLIRNNKSTYHTIPQLVDQQQPITPRYQQSFYQPEPVTYQQPRTITYQQPAVEYQQPAAVEYQQPTYQSYPVYQQQQQTPVYQSYQTTYQQQYQDYSYPNQEYYPAAQDPYAYVNNDYSYQQLYY